MTDTASQTAEPAPPPGQPATAVALQPAPVPAAAPEAKRKRRKPSEEELSDRKIKKWSELWETIILTVATLATVWAGYQSGMWSGTQSSANVDSIALRVEASQLTASAQQLQLADVTLFTNWVNAVAEKDQARAEFYVARFRSEFKPAFEAWLATKPLTTPDAPGSPFEMAEYKVSGLEKAKEKEAKSALRSEEGERAGSIGDQYTLTAVILAGSLLLAGIASRFTWEELRAVVVGSALVVLLFCVIRLITLPFA